MKTLVELVSRGYMYVIQKKFFFGYVFGRSLSGRAIQGFRPHRSSTLQVRSSLAMLQSGADTLAFSSLFFRVAGSSLTCNVTERFGQHRSTLAFFHVAGSSLACNVTERLGQPCSLTIPNAEKRLPALLPGHLSSAWCCQTERNTCRLSHGCTPFRCGVGLRRYGLRCLLALHRVPR